MRIAGRHRTPTRERVRTDPSTVAVDSRPPTTSEATPQAP